LTCAADVEPREVDWLWPGRVPLGMITLFAGDPKLGKSYVALATAAALSRGLPLPMGDLPNRPGSTILMSAEDDPGRTIVPRLIVAGADLAKVHILESISGPAAPAISSLPTPKTRRAGASSWSTTAATWCRSRQPWLS